MRVWSKAQRMCQAVGDRTTRRAYMLKTGGVVGSALRTILFVGISYVILFPVMTKISSSFMERQDLFDQTVRWIPRHFTLENYRLVLEHMKYGRAFLNSFALAFGISVLQTLSCALVGYGFARFDFPGRSLFFGLVIFTLIVPPQMIMTPMYLNFRYFDMLGILPGPGLNLLNSFWPFILMAATATGLRNGLFIYISRQCFRGMPRDLEDAAYVDGAGPIRTFIQVMLPGVAPGLLIVFLFSFVWQWNDDYLTTIFAGRQTLLTNMLGGLLYSIHGMERVTGQYASLINNTGSLLFMAPLLVMYAFMQRYFVESIERSGLVG